MKKKFDSSSPTKGSGAYKRYGRHLKINSKHKSPVEPPSALAEYRLMGILIFLFGNITVGWAQTNQFVEIKGMGGQSCGQYALHRKGAPPLLQQLYLQWSQGLISGYNLGVPLSGKDLGQDRTAVKVPSEETIQLYLDKYCQDNPLGYVTGGVTSLIREIGGLIGPSRK